MSKATTDNLKYFSGAMGIHALLVVMLLGAGLIHRRPIQPQLSLKAVMVDRATLDQLAKQTAPVAPPVPEVKPAEPDPAELQRQKEQQQAELQKQQQAKEQKLKEQQIQEQAEQARQAVLWKQQAEAEKQKQLAAQRSEVEAAQKRQQQEAQQRRIAEIQQMQRDAELKRQAEADAKAQKAREAELNAQLAAEEGRTTAVNSGLLNQYVALIQQKVIRNWIRPPTAKQGLECEVKVTQAMGGTVLSVSVGRCNGDQAVRASIETAVNASSPLPAPPDARLFDRNLAFIFKPVD